MKWTLVRLVVFFAVLAGIDIGCQVAPARLHLPWRPQGGLGDIANAIGLSIAMIIAYRLLVRWIETRKADELSARSAPPFVLAGVIGGGALFFAVYAMLAWQGVAHIGAFAGVSDLPRAVAIALASAVGEEIVFRGALFRILEEGFGTLAALFVSAGLFGLLHATNPGATLVSAAAIAIEAGIFLAAAYIASRSLWLPIGLHFGWNFVEGGVFGAAVSGGNSHGLFSSTFSGPPVLTGGAFGPEASVVAVGASLVASLILIAFAASRGQWQPTRLLWKLEPKPLI